MKKVLCSLLVVFSLVACSPSQEDIQATVQASIAETQAAIPTLTFTPEPTSTPVPTRTPAPTKTLIPTPTVDYNRFKSIFPDLVAGLSETQLGKRIEVLDFEYSGSPKPTTLTIRISADKSNFKVGEAMGATLQIISLSIKNEPHNFPATLETLILQEYDGLIERGSFTVDWSDMKDFASGKITNQQLILRGVLEVK